MPIAKFEMKEKQNWGTVHSKILSVAYTAELLL